MWPRTTLRADRSPVRCSCRPLKSLALRLRRRKQIFRALQPGVGPQLKKKPHSSGWMQLFDDRNRVRSDYGNVFSLWAFLALCDRELDLLAFLQRPKSGAADGTEVYEHVGALFLFDKAKPLGFIEPFDVAGTLIRHSVFLLLTLIEASAGRIRRKILVSITECRTSYCRRDFVLIVH